MIGFDLMDLFSVINLFNIFYFFSLISFDFYADLLTQATPADPLGSGN